MQYIEKVTIFEGKKEAFLILPCPLTIHQIRNKLMLAGVRPASIEFKEPDTAAHVIYPSQYKNERRRPLKIAAAVAALAPKITTE